MNYRTLLIAIVLTACGANAEDATTDPTAGSDGTATESEPKSDDVIPATTTTAKPSYASVLSAIAGAPNAGTVAIGVAGSGVAGVPSTPVVAGSSSVAVTAIVSGLGGASSVATTLSPNRPFAAGGSVTTTPTTKVVVAGLGGSASTSTMNLTPPISPDADVVCCLFNPLSTSCDCFGGKEAECVARVKSGSTRCASAP
jgi:hypothetical protein